MMADRIGVVGGGTMGAGIAQAALSAGYAVVLVEASAEAAARACERITSGLAGAADRGRLAGTVEQHLDHLQLVTTPEALGDVTLAVESVPERFELKQAVLAEAERHVNADTVLASNTSSISIDRLSEALQAPDRFVGLHFFNPVHAMKLIELVVGTRSGAAAVAAGHAFAGRLGKQVVQVSDSPGFVTSRLGVVFGLEAARMLEQGIASAEDIDRAIELGYGHPMGPLRLTDQVGLDVRVDVADALRAQLHDGQYAAPQLLRDKVAAGELGRKSGRGLYDWTATEAPA